MRFSLALLAFLLPAVALAEWSGNMAVNPGFEEDFVFPGGEAHVLSFKGDWYYNQTDGVPDYWALPAGNWERRSSAPRSGAYCLYLGEGAVASRGFPVALVQSGGGSWGGVVTDVPNCQRPEQFPRSVRASVWCRGGGELRLTYSGVTKSAKSEGAAENQWGLVEVEIPAGEQPPGSHNSMSIELVGPGEFDDVALQEELGESPNLLQNPGFEDLTDGFPAGWSGQKKYTWLGPTYYIWTDWYHFHEPNRGSVAVDTLITHSGRASLRFDVMPGDEKMVESPEIVLNQDVPRMIEVGAMVRADRIRLIDIRAINEDGVDVPSARPMQPEQGSGGTAVYGNGTFGWRYVRKIFTPKSGVPLKSIRVRLCARGFNGCTLDDGGTRHYCLQSGTVWWDDVRVVERESNEEQLTARGVEMPAAQAAPQPSVQVAEIDFGERLVGPDAVKLSLKDAAGVSLRLTQTLPDGSLQSTSAEPDPAGDVVLPYETTEPVGDFEKPAFLEITALRGNKEVGTTKVSYYTWPVVADFDFEYHYTYPDENPVVCSINLGVTRALIQRIASIELLLKHRRDDSIISKQTIPNAAEALAAGAAKKWPDERIAAAYCIRKTDYTNLLGIALDLSKLKVWPQDEPTLDTYVHLRALDQGGNLVFDAMSQPIGRVEAFDRSRMELVETVKIRKEDGAVLVNGKPVFLTGGTHGNMRLSHGPEELAKYGFRGHRLTGGNLSGGFGPMWEAHRLWELQTKPVAAAGTTDVLVELSDDQFAALANVVKEGKHLNVVCYNTGGWEAILWDKSQWAAHYKSNDAIRKLTGRLVSVSTSGAYNAWEFARHIPWYDINHAETEMWGPMDFNTIYLPHANRLAPEGKVSTWIYLPQLYDNHPFARLRFETYENIIRGSCGYSMIQGIGDPSFNRGMCGELRYLEAPLYSLEKTPEVSISPNVSHKVTCYKDNLYILATNAGPIGVGAWKWHAEQKLSGRASHEGDSRNSRWRNPNGWHLHGYRGDPCGGSVPKIHAGDKIVQYVWIDPDDTPECVAFGVRGDGMFAHNVTLGTFIFEQFATDASNVFFYTELNHSTWHHVGHYFDKQLEERARKVMGDEYANNVRASSDSTHEWVTKNIYQPQHFVSLGNLPASGTWHKIEVSAEEVGLVGKLVDGFFFASKNGRALWDHTALVRDGEELAVFCEDTMGIPPDALKEVTISVPGVPDGTSVKVLFEERTLTVQGGRFTDNFVGEDAYGREWGGVVGDNFAYMPGRGDDEMRELVSLMPSGYGYDYNSGKTCVHIYEIPLKQ